MTPRRVENQKSRDHVMECGEGNSEMIKSGKEMGPGLKGAVFAAIMICACGAQDANAGARAAARERATQMRQAAAREMLAEAEKQAIERFQNIGQSSDWDKLLARPLGRMRFVNTPTATATQAVAERLGYDLVVAPGIAGTVTYDQEGTLEDFLLKGINPRYWYLAMEGEKLHLKPHVARVIGSISAERGAHYDLHREELEQAARRCGAMTEYGEQIATDEVGAVTMTGRVWFIDLIMKELDIEGTGVDTAPATGQPVRRTEEAGR
jgi:hypothetical protein